MPPRCQLLSGRLSTHPIALRSAAPLSRSYADSAADSADIPSTYVKNPLKRRKGGDLGSHLPKHVIPTDAYIPPYPYGDYQLFKQANRGLYGEQAIQFGNNVSKKTETKTRRNWAPNVLSKSLYSIALKKKIKLRLTAKVLKTIDREGGLDEYLLKDSQHRIKELGPMGWALRWTLMQNPGVIARLRADAAALGIDQATIDKVWPSIEIMAEQKKAQGHLAQQAQANSLVSDAFTVTEEQQMWDPEEDEPAPPPKSAEEKEAIRHAIIEYNTSVGAAKRYLDRGLVDSEEEGLKLAFVRAEERQEAYDMRKRSFAEKLNQFSAEEVEDIKKRFKCPNISDHAARKIAYNQRKRQEVEESGDYAAYKEAKQAAWLAERGFQPTDKETYAAERKAKWAKLLEEAETAATNTELSPERRAYLVDAINKADRLIKAKASGGKPAYIEAMLEDLNSKQMGSGNDLSALMDGTGDDGWASIVATTNKPTETPSRA